MVSLKPGHMDWVQDFYFMLYLPPPPLPRNYYLILRRIPYQSLWSYPRNRPLINSWESQSLTAATIHKDSDNVYVLSWSTWSVQSTYVFKREQELVNKMFMLYVFQVGLLNELLLLWRCVIVMVKFHCNGDGLLLWWCVTVMVMCYSYGDVSLLWWYVTVMVMCYHYGDVLLLWWRVTVMVMCYFYGDVLL